MVDGVPGLESERREAWEWDSAVVIHVKMDLCNLFC